MERSRVLGHHEKTMLTNHVDEGKYYGKDIENIFNKIVEEYFQMFEKEMLILTRVLQNTRHPE